MKCVIFAVILLGMQTSTTPPQKAADSAAHVRQRSKNQSNPNHSPAPHTGVGVVENPTQQIEDKSSGTGAGNTERGVEVTHLPPVTVNPPKRDLADWGYWAFSGLLVVVGILQVVLLCWTLRAARQQASEMHRQ